MKVINLKANNIQRITAVDITPEGNTVILTGKNAQGKTSVLNSILYAIGGKDALPDMPIRTGEEKGDIRLELSDYIIERKFTRAGSYLTVTNKEGLEYKKPQALLDGFMGSISFDPLEFSRMKTKDQYESLRTLCGVDYDFQAADNANTIDYETRHGINKQVKELDVQISDIEKSLPENLPEQLVGISVKQDLLNQNQKTIDNAKDHELKIKECDTKAEISEERIKKIDGEVEELQQKIKTLQAEQAEAILKRDAAKSEKVGLEGSLKNVRALEFTAERIAEINEEIAQAGTTNFNINQRDITLRGKKQDREDKKAESERLTKIMEEREVEKQKAIESAKMPIPGLSFKDGKVYFNDIPFSQASSAEQLKVSTAIAMAYNPKLRVIRIKDGSLLDEDGMKLLKQMAEEKDFQIWVETCYTNDPAAVVITDGHVKE